MLRCIVIFIATLFCLGQQSCVIDNVDDPASVSGVISGTSGSGVSGVKITVKSDLTDIAGETASDGSFSLSMPSGGTAYLTFTKEGYTPQSKGVVFRGGDAITVNVKLTTLAEDSFFIVEKEDFLFKSTGGYGLISIRTNVAYELKCDADWIEVGGKNSGLFTCLENKTSQARTTVIRLEAEYGHTETITVKQEAAPV